MPTITGKTSGELRKGGRVAARLGAWTFQGTLTAFTITAAVEETTPIFDFGGPFELRLLLREGVWIWDAVETTGDSTRVHIKGAGEPDYEPNDA